MMLFLELFGAIIDHPHVPIVAAELHVAIGGNRAEIARLEVEQCDIERAAAEVVNEHLHRLPRLAFDRQIAEALAERERGGGRLVDDVEHGQPGHLAGVGGCLAARLVEIGGHGDHGLDIRPQHRHRIVFELLEDAGLDDLGMELFAVDWPRIGLFAHIALDEFGDRPGFHRRGLLGLLADDDFGILEEHDARRDHVPFGISGDLRLAFVVQIGNDRIGRAQVDSNGVSLHRERGAERCSGLR